jgi:multidrug efflux pump subunit AcrA (membrane-fusion protein)
VTLAIVLAGCNVHDLSLRFGGPVPVSIIQPEEQSWPASYEANGTVRADAETGRNVRYLLEVPIEDSLRSAIRTGYPVSVYFDAVDKPIEARVCDVVRNPISRAFVARIDVPEVSPLRSGMFGRAVFEMGKSEVLTVPAGAVDQADAVFVIEDGKAKERAIKSGRTTQNAREILAGLNRNEHLIYPIPAGLRDGARVEIR